MTQIETNGDPSWLLPVVIRHKVSLKLGCQDSNSQGGGLEDAKAWFDKGWQLWKKTLRSRRDWRTRRALKHRQLLYAGWFKSGELRKLLRATLGGSAPPVSIRGALVGEEGQREYVESRGAVTTSLVELLNTWIPPDERTTEPRHLSSMSAEDIATLPVFVREWLLADINSGGSLRSVYASDEFAWHNFHYDEARQKLVDQKVSKGVAPGFGGVSQELWVAAPNSIRNRERLIFNTILRTGMTPKYFNNRQMIFLPKSAIASSVWERRGLPPWRPITVQCAMATRLFTALNTYLESTAPNHPLQHGFQRDRNVQDASLSATLLLDRAKRRREHLFLLSKDCEKCFDRVPKWVMAYIYKRLGIPDTLHQILMGFLSAGDVRVRTDYGWISSGDREFGLGQGSVLSVRHIGYYMDVLIERQQQGPNGVTIRHSQGQDPLYVATTVLVDDIIDISTTKEGIEHRVATSNCFTGIQGTGGVFGAAKSFLLHYDPSKGSRAQHHTTVFLHDGKGIPRQVSTVSPYEGFKHLGVFQGPEDLWSRTFKPVWDQITSDAERLMRVSLHPDQLRYIVNHVWLPRVLYRMDLSTSIKLAKHVDIIIRKVARHTLKLPRDTPVHIFHDENQGIGLHSCEDMCIVRRVHTALRVLNTPHTVAHHLLTEALEDYQIKAGLTDHPLVAPLEPPSHCQSWVHNAIRGAAKLHLRMDAKWIAPAPAVSRRPNDRSLWTHLSRDAQLLLLRFNLAHNEKLRFVGDIADSMGVKMITRSELVSRYKCTGRKRERLEELEQAIASSICMADSRALIEPIGKVRITTDALSMPRVTVGVDQFFVVSQFECRDSDDDEDDDDLRLRHHEIGQRIGRQIRNDGDGFGDYFDVRWWQERDHGSGVWSKRTGNHAFGQEFVDVCVPVEVTKISAARIIVWDDTTVVRRVNGVDTAFTGTMPRSLIMDSFVRSAHRARTAGSITPSSDTPLTSLQLPCGGCNRLTGTTLCARCLSWHHENCVICPPVTPATRGTSWAQCFSSTEHTSQRIAGDGSVRHAGTDRASGGWSLCTGESSQIGATKVHPLDITSTRCELHALIAGVIRSRDSGVQICDNKSAISVLARARALRRAGSAAHIKYSDKHRVEIRTLVKHMQEDGTFNAKWVRSHQEAVHTEDQLLEADREALAIADRAANVSHDAAMQGSYTHLICWDDIHVLDQEGRPVVGDVMRFLTTMASRRRNRLWIEAQQMRGPAHMTACVAAEPMGKRMGWSKSEQRFYWRTIAGVLPTNVRTKRFCEQWPSHCRACGSASEDTQAHRFGLEGDCVNSHLLWNRLGVAFDRTCEAHWIPDQEFYLPGRGDQLATRHQLQQRALWHNASHGSSQRPMVEISPGIWVHALQLHALLRDPVQSDFAGTLFDIEDCLLEHGDTTALLPRVLQAAVQQCSPGASALDFHPSQASGLWRQGRMARWYPIREAQLNITHVAGPEGPWWIDDTFIPESAEYWEEMLTERRERAATLWLACTDGSCAFEMATRYDVIWWIHIPAGELRMRTRSTIHQTVQCSRGALTTTNTAAVWIGVIPEADDDQEFDRWGSVWKDALQHNFSITWLCPELSEGTSNCPTARTSLITTVRQLAAAQPDAALQENRHWLTEHHREVFEDPTARSLFLTATPGMIQWSLSLNHTHREARSWLTSLLKNVWETLQEHWLRTCDLNMAAVERSGTMQQLSEINRQVQDRRREWNRATPGLTRAIQRHTQQLQARAAKWHRSRPSATTRSYGQLDGTLRYGARSTRRGITRSGTTSQARSSRRRIHRQELPIDLHFSNPPN